MISRFAMAVLVAAVSLLLLGEQAVAQPATGGQDYWGQCLGSTSPDVVISACSRVIVPPVDPPGDIAIALNARGNAYSSKGDYDRAMADFSEALVHRPNYAEAWKNRGALYAEKGRYDLAIANFSHALEVKASYVAGRLTPAPIDDAAVLCERGRSYAGMEDADRAMADYNESIRIRPNDPGCYYNRGSMYNNKGDYSRAIEDYNKAIHLDSKSAYAFFGRGIAERNLGDDVGSVRDIEAARLIDPKIADTISHLKGWGSFTSNESLSPNCQEPAEGSARTANQSNSESAAVSYVEAPLEQLKKAVPALRGIDFAGDPNAADRMDPPGRAELKLVLDRTSANVATMFRRMPNLVAKEEVIRSFIAPTEFISETPASQKSESSSYVIPHLQTSQQRPPATQYQTQVFSYRIRPRQDRNLDVSLGEFRTYKNNRSVDDSVSKPDEPHSLGFATVWRFFLPNNLKGSRFRYLGQQKVDGHTTDIVAFAEIAGQAPVRTMIVTQSGNCSTLVQGVAWIDRSTYQIVRMQTDLQAPLSGIHMSQLRAVLNYGEVKIPQRDLFLWLPRTVKTEWNTTGKPETELHRYSNYKLFTATVTLLDADGKPMH